MATLAAILVLIVNLTYYVGSYLIVGEKKKNIFKTDGKYTYVFGLIVIATIGFGSISFLNIDILDNNDMKWFWLGFLILITGFNSFVEWKFLKDSKEYLVSLIAMIVGTIYILLFMF